MLILVYDIDYYTTDKDNMVPTNDQYVNWKYLDVGSSLHINTLSL